MQFNYSSLLNFGLTICVILFLPAGSAARVIHLPQEYKTIQQAIDAAQAGDQINLTAGNYKGNIILKPGVSIYGEDARTTLIVASPWLSIPVVTTADGCTLDGVTIKGAKAGSRAAIYIEDGSPRISCCIITDNQTSGIVIEKGATPAIEQNQIFENHRSAIEIINAAPLILANKLFANYGDGIIATDSAAHIEDNHIYNNLHYGINITNTIDELDNPDPPQLAIVGNTIENNGGEIVCKNSSPVIEGNTVANKLGLAISLFESDAVIKNNKIISDGPPAIRIDSGNPIIEENTISGVLRFPIMGESKHGSIKNNRVEIIRGPQFEMQRKVSPSVPGGS
jgi:hypothetical protein